MAGTTVTGSGPGDSHGHYKPENNCGCGGCGQRKEKEEPKRVRYCSIRYTCGNSTAVVCSAGRVTLCC